ncbi:hypothetical protein KSD_54850 [Ktedonobacter sp. SOSP1-85]|nr:hypothetical protein KSD_54850 [Ktedonobacter sp. SOSP1-85]
MARASLAKAYLPTPRHNMLDVRGQCKVSKKHLEACGLSVTVAQTGDTRT